MSDRGPYEIRGANRDLLECQAPEVLLAGPAGCGKSVACLLKLHWVCSEVPNVRALMVRKTRASLTESALVTFEEKVVPARHPILKGASRAMRQAYRYPNGSTLVVGGLDNPGKIFSTEFDLAYVQEAIELDEGAWEALTTRMRNNRLSYQQVVGDTNPSTPTHWLKARCNAGRTLLLEGRHEDNPALWDGRGWTPDGARYLAKLDALTGPRLQRLRWGRWVQAEGVVYEGWDRRLHVVPRFVPPGNWPRYWSVDFGFTNPLVCLCWAQDSDGRLYLYREWYHTGVLVEDAAREWRKLAKGEPRPRAVICDHDAEGRATLERHLGWKTTPARKQIREGIQAVAARLRPAKDGRPRLLVMEGALVRRDPALVEAKKPTCWVEEVDGYVWDTGGGRKQGEEPVDRDNHAADALRYLCAKDLAPKARPAVALGAPPAGPAPRFAPPGGRAAGDAPAPPAGWDW